MYLDLKEPIALSIKTAQKPYIIGALGPKAFRYESLDAKGRVLAIYIGFL